MMRIGDERNLLQLARPGDALEKLIRMRDVALDLVPLGVVEAPFADREIPHLVGREKRLRRSVEGQVIALRPRLELVEAAVGENAGLVRLKDDLEEPVQLR